MSVSILYPPWGFSYGRKQANISIFEKIKKTKTPLLKELSRTSRDSFESESDSKESWDVRLNSFKKWQNEKTPLLKDLSRSSRDFFESESDSKESRDVHLNFFKRGILRFFDSIDSRFISIRSILLPSVVMDHSDDKETDGSNKCSNKAQ